MLCIQRRSSLTRGRGNQRSPHFILPVKRIFAIAKLDLVCLTPKLSCGESMMASAASFRERPSAAATR